MGNVVSDENLNDCCSGRGGSHVFLPPNTDKVTYEFHSSKHGEIRFWNGVAIPVTTLGFPLESPGKERNLPKWRTLWEYSPDAAGLKLYLSGRFLVQCSMLQKKKNAQDFSRDVQSHCIFKVCTRGRPVFESVKTQSFTHTAHVVTAGLFFALYVIVVNECICLNPRVMLVLETGDEVTLVEDKMGPLTAEESFLVDFAVVDDLGRNVQMDLIFRGLPEGPPGADMSIKSKSSQRGFRTLRTCLQEYTTFNSQVSPPCVAVGSTELTGLSPSATVHLQNLVLSEEKVDGVHLKDEKTIKGQPQNQQNSKKEPMLANTNQAGAFPPTNASPGAVGGYALMHHMASVAAFAATTALRTSGKVLFEGSSATVSSPRRHQGRANEPGKKKDFWHHIRYDADPERGTRLSSLQQGAGFCGEFWMSQEKVPTKNLFFHCSSTLAQAIEMCVIFRLRLQPDFLSLIENQASSVLRDLHIPTSGVVMGVERDPRHQHLVRMFIEHRNEILDDMVVCECKATDLARTVCVQEIFDSGANLFYRIVLYFPDGTHQQAILQFDAVRIEESNLKERHSYVEEPSVRFPISPFSSCLSGQPLNSEHRVFVFTAIAHEPDARWTPNSEQDVQEGGSLDGDLFASPCAPSTNPRAFPDWGNQSDGTAEDWHSSHGQSDGENEGAGKSRKTTSETLPDQEMTWRRPLVDSIVLIEDVEEPPFKHIPGNMP